MDDVTFAVLAKVLGAKIHDLTVGFAAMFNLCVEHGVFDASEFHEEREKVESSPDLVKLRKFLDALPNAKEPEDFEALLRDYTGPLQ